MRRINFRAWDATFKKMYYEGFYLDSKGDLSFDSSVFIRPYYDPLNIDVMQFTGRKDCNGKEIYEGDILSSPTLTRQGRKNGHSYTIVKWSDKNSGFGSVNSGGNSSIIGNIYENPELLT